MFSKSIFFTLMSMVAVAVAINIPAEGKIQSHAQIKANDLIVGSRLNGDQLYLQEFISKGSSILQVVTVTKDYKVKEYEKITQVVCLDQKTDGTGAFPTILEGGPGYNSVTIKFKSQRGSGIKFQVQIYSK